MLHMFYILLDYNSSLSRITSIHSSIAVFLPVQNDLCSLEGLYKYRFLFDHFCCYHSVSLFLFCLFLTLFWKLILLSSNTFWPQFLLSSLLSIPPTAPFPTDTLFLLPSEKKNQASRSQLNTTKENMIRKSKSPHTEATQSNPRDRKESQVMWDFPLYSMNMFFIILS